MTISTQFMAVKTSRPMPNPKGIVIPGAWNFKGASMSEMPMINPSHTAGRTTRAPATSRVSWVLMTLAIPRIPLPVESGQTAGR